MPCGRCGGSDHNVRSCTWPTDDVGREPLPWEQGWHPVGWTRGEFLTLVPPDGQFRGYVEIAMDADGIPVVPRARTVKHQIEFSACDAERVDRWLQWWRKPAYADRVSL